MRVTVAIPRKTAAVSLDIDPIDIPSSPAR
jgi:hypothetical protein